MYDMESLRRDYEIDYKDLRLAGKTFRFATPRTIDRFIDVTDIRRNFPLWVKIWQASWILAEYMAQQPPNTGDRILELGSGIGVVGVVASVFGHRVTLTEYDPHALNFAAANACLNGCLDLNIKKLDWHRPEPDDPYDWIIGSEVLYHERDLEPLLKLFRSYLKPGGRITLTMGVRRDGMAMLDTMRRFYNLRLKKFTLRSEDEAEPILLCHMTPVSD